ncbi:hypothetical protein D3C87_1661880 [compost metagenome]
MQRPGLSRGILPDSRGSEHFTTGLIDRLSGFEGFAQRQFFAVLPNQCGSLQQHGGAQVRRGSGPGSVIESPPGRRHRLIDIRHAPRWIDADRHIVRRAEARHLLERRTLGPLPIDEHVEVSRLRWQLIDPGGAIVVIHKNVLCTAFDSGGPCSNSKRMGCPPNIYN